MIYADEKLIRELKKPLERACKEIGKRRGWKTIAGTQYQVRGEVLYILRVSLPLFDNGQTAEAALCCKPVALDELFWEIFQMKEDAEKMPFSFHVNGAFTAQALTLGRWKQHLPSPEELEPTVETVFDQAEAMVEQNPFPDIASYRARWEAEPLRSNRTLSIVLCLLCEGKYRQAMDGIDAALARHDNGGFSRMNGKQGFMEDARDWCAARLTAETQTHEN